MPAVDVAINDLERLVGRKLSTEEIEKYLPMLKCEIESIEENVVYYEATHDRPDLFSAEGLGRALKGLLEIEKGLRVFNISKDRVELYNEGPKYRPYVLGAVVRNLSLDEESVRQIMNLQERLHVTYCRNRRKVSIGVYDLDAIKPPIYYKAVDPDSVSFVPLDEKELMTLREILRKTEKGREYAHLIAEYKQYPLLVDSENKVLSMPPIINSEDTRVAENTKNVFIDVTGTDLEAMMDIITIVATSIAERGNPEEIVPVVVYMKEEKKVSPRLETYNFYLNRDLVTKISGLSLDSSTIKDCLEKMRHKVEEVEENVFKVDVAPYRIDILHPIDLVEDVLMAYDYEKIEPEFLPPTGSGKVAPVEVISRKVKDIMIGLGFQEVANYMMSNPETLIKKMRLEEKVVEVKNPKLEKYTALRNWIIPQLLEVVSANKKIGYPIKIFEVGDVAILDESRDVKARIERHLAATTASPEVTLTDALVLCKSFFKTLGLDYTLKETIHRSFIEGRCAEIICGGRRIGILGEIHPEVLTAFEIETPVAAIELNISGLLELLA
ncbi:MAG: phenylalanine--tRNA ligase subunit beta [Thermoprotei archaeon]|nr:MAG: phenylalanine--tRNA ligase subunit beta [Thermoprotei archaeon]